MVGVTAYDSHGIFGSCLEWPAVHDGAPVPVVLQVAVVVVLGQRRQRWRAAGGGGGGSAAASAAAAGAGTAAATAATAAAVADCMALSADCVVSIDWHDIVPTNHDTVIDLAYSVVKQVCQPVRCERCEPAGATAVLLL